MTPTAAMFLKAFKDLPPSEQLEVTKGIIEYTGADRDTKKTLGESFEKRARDKVLLGPTSNPCPTCGR